MLFARFQCDIRALHLNCVENASISAQCKIHEYSLGSKRIDALTWPIKLLLKLILKCVDSFDDRKIDIVSRAKQMVDR